MNRFYITQIFNNTYHETHYDSYIWKLIVLGRVQNLVTVTHTNPYSTGRKTHKLLPEGPFRPLVNLFILFMGQSISSK